MDANISNVASGSCPRNQLEPYGSCSADQPSCACDTAQDKLVRKCFLHQEDLLFAHTTHQNQSPDSVSLEQNIVERDRDLDSPDQDYDFNSRFSPQPTDASYNSESNCYGNAEDERHDTDDSDTPSQRRQKRRPVGPRECKSNYGKPACDAGENTDCIGNLDGWRGKSTRRGSNEEALIASGPFVDQVGIDRKFGKANFEEIKGKPCKQKNGNRFRSSTSASKLVSPDCQGNQLRGRSDVLSKTAERAVTSNTTSSGAATNTMNVADVPLQKNWSRSNIAVTMERYEPSSPLSPCHSPNRPDQMSTQSRHHTNESRCPEAHHYSSFHHDYSYAYYEPGAAMRHANIPGSPLCGPGSSTIYRPFPPNSIQALLLKSQGYQTKMKKQLEQQQHQKPTSCTRGRDLQLEKHAYTTRYGTQENIYEEIGNEDRLRMMMVTSQSGSTLPRSNQTLVEEEFRQVHNRHRRVLGELNLSVEVMLMPPLPLAENTVRDVDDETVELQAHETLVSALSHQIPHPTRNHFDTRTVRNTNLLGRGVCRSDFLGGNESSSDCGQLVADMDSGFSGSSGASYVGSLRYQKSQCCPSAQQQGLIARGGMTMGPRAYEPHVIATRSTPSYGSATGIQNLNPKIRSAEDPGPSSHHLATKAKQSMTGTSATLKPMSKNASFWSKKGWNVIPNVSPKKSLGNSS